MVHATLHTDGGSRGNPGPAGIGFTLEMDDGLTYRGGSFIGETSNNVAEYNALVWGLENAKAAGITHLDIQADSELMVNQVTGVYRVRNEGLKPLFAQVRVLLGSFQSFTIEHVYRENNAAADALANEAMDAHATVGEFLRKPTLKQSLFDLASAPDITDPQPVLPAVGFYAGPHAEEPVVATHAVGTPEVMNEAEQRGANMQNTQTYLSATQLSPAHHDELTTPVRREAAGIYELTVKSHFDAAHALVGYQGQCSNLHGHTWDVEVSVEGTRLDEIGILYDFKALKKDLENILEQFDHKYLNEIDIFAKENSTAENMARIIFDQLEETLPSIVSLSEVCVWESPVARLRYRRPKK